MINAGENLETPRHVADLVQTIRDADTDQKVSAAKTRAVEVLAVIDRLTARSVPDALGRLASALSRKYGISTPDWTSVT